MSITAALLIGCLFAAEEAPAPAPKPDGVIQQFLDAHGTFLDQCERSVPNLFVSGLWQDEVALGSLAGAYELERQSAIARIPVPVHEDAYISATLYYHRRRYNVTEPISGLPGDETVHAVELGLATRFWVNADLMVHPFFYAGVYSDLDGHVRTDDWQLYGGVLAYYRYTERFYVRAGLAAAQDLAHIAVIPLVGFYWRPMDTLHLGLLVPFSASVSWWPAPWCELLLEGTFEGFEHYTRMPRAQNHQGFDWRLREYRLMAGPVLFLGGGWRLRLMAGAQLDGSWDTRGATRDHSSLGVAPVVEVGLGWRIPTGD